MKNNLGGNGQIEYDNPYPRLVAPAAMVDHSITRKGGMSPKPRGLGELKERETSTGAQVALLAENEPATQCILRGLSAAGAHVWSASTAAACMTALQREEVDLLILELLMRRTDGLRLFLHCRQRHPFLPIVTLTENLNEEMIVTLCELETGCPWPRFPIDPYEVSRQIRRSLDSQPDTIE